MTRARLVASVTMGLLFAGAPALAGGGLWVEFVNESATRMNPSMPVNDLLGKDDPQEKDYAWGDVDMDGDIDLVVARKFLGSNSGGEPNVLFMNEVGVLVDRTADFAIDSTDGTQGFNDITPDRDVTLIDLNGDGWLDILTASSGAYGGGPKTITHPRVYINLGNDGGGNWLGFRYEEFRIPTLAQTPNFCGIAFGDVDGLIALGGPPDAYFTDYTNTLEDRILTNNGSGTFSDVTGSRFAGNTSFLTATFTPHATMGDINGDGYNDIVKNSALGPYEMKIAYNDPGSPGTFSSANSDIIYTGADYFLAVGDLNNDGMLDIVEVDDGSDRWFRNTGNVNDKAVFVQHTFPNTGGFGSNVVIADLNKDGFMEVLIADVDVDLPSCTNNRLKILHNLGGPPVVGFDEDTANIPTTVPGGPLAGAHDVAVFDVNGDTWPDLVIGTCNGTTVWINQPPIGIAFVYPLGLPTFAALDGSTVIQVQFTANGEPLDTDSPAMHVSINGGGFTETPMTDLGGGLYSANLPAGTCLDDLSFYFSASLSSGLGFTDPPLAPAATYAALVANGIGLALLDEMEADVSGWTVVNDPSLVTGAWEQADPNPTISPGGQLAAPDDDATPAPGVLAFVTENGPPGGPVGANDVDGGPTRLISPAIDLDGTDAVITYQRWFFTETGAPDSLTTEVSNDGTSWVLVHSTSSTGSAWQQASFRVSDFVAPSATVQVRFSTQDEFETADSSFTEAGIDDFRVDAFICGPLCLTDINGDGTTDVLDLISLLLCFGQPATPPCDLGQDINQDGDVDVLDLIQLLLAFGSECP